MTNRNPKIFLGIFEQTYGSFAALLLIVSAMFYFISTDASQSNLSQAMVKYDPTDPNDWDQNMWQCRYCKVWNGSGGKIRPLKCMNCGKTN